MTFDRFSCMQDSSGHGMTIPMKREPFRVNSSSQVPLTVS